MIYDLFTSADFCYSNFSLLNLVVWLMGMVWIFWKINLYFFSSSRIKKMTSFFLNWHYENVKNEMLDNKKGAYLLMSGLFMIMLGSNIWGLFPYIFGITTQMVFTFILAFMVWLSIVGSSLLYSFMSFLGHMTPTGSPKYLAPILNVMELVSKLMRPLTLALRLSMNMTTGHVLMSLMSSSSVISLFSAKMLVLLLSMIMSGYILFEVGICMIQGFVFSLLTVNYLSEHT